MNELKDSKHCSFVLFAPFFKLFTLSSLILGKVDNLSLIFFAKLADFVGAPQQTSIIKIHQRGLDSNGFTDRFPLTL